MSTGTSLTSWGAIRLVAGREIMTRLRSKSFVWLTVILVGAVVLGGVGLFYTSDAADE